MNPIDPSNRSGPGRGGAIYKSDSGTLTVLNSTFSGNRASFGGGILNFDILTVANSAFTQNGVEFVGGGIYNEGTLHLKNAILADSLSGGDCANQVDGFVIPSGVNLIEDGSCGADADPAHFMTGDPVLGPLADNGGSPGSMPRFPAAPPSTRPITASAPATPWTMSTSAA